MANTLGITEVTMAQVVLAATAINTRAARPSDLGTGGPLVVRITDHADNDDTEEGTDTDKMAIFHSRQFGQPWKKDYTLERVIHAAGTGAAIAYTQSAGVIDAIVITNGGSGYVSSSLVFTPASGTGASFTATIVDGVITAVAIVAGGTAATNGALVVTSVAPTNASTIFPDYDYSTFA